MIKLSCKSCGAKLELTEDIDRFSCASCGAEWLVQRSGGIVSLKGVEEGIQAISESTEILAIDVKARMLRERIRDLQETIRTASMLEAEPNIPLVHNPEFDEWETKYNDARISRAIFIGFAILVAPVIFYSLLSKVGSTPDPQIAFAMIKAGFVLIIATAIILSLYWLLYRDKIPPMPERVILAISKEQNSEAQQKKIIEAQQEIKDIQAQLKVLEAKIL